MTIEYINPPSIARSPAFSQAIAVSGNVKTVYIGQQNGVDKEGKVAGDIVAQTKQALQNFDACLDAAGASKDQIVSLTFYVTQGEDMMAAAMAGLEWWGQRPNPPVNSGMFVTGFFPPERVVGIEGIAVVLA